MTFVVYMLQIFLKEACEKVKFNSKTIIVSLRDCPLMSHAVLISNILHLFCPINEIDEKHFSFTFTLINLLADHSSPFSSSRNSRETSRIVILSVVVARLKIFTSLEHI